MVRALMQWWQSAGKGAGSVSSSRTGDCLVNLPTQDEIRRLLQRERARADRTGHPLSVLVYASTRNLDQLVGVLRERLRNTDEVGWLDDNRICAVLPDTPAIGALKVLDDIARNWPEQVAVPDCEVYTYPDQPSKDVFEVQPRGAENLQPGTTPERPAQVVPALEPLLAVQMPLWKRTLDIAIAATALVLLAPVLLLTALAVKMTSKGPVLFWQRRSGHGGRPFWMCKFRTMVVDAEARKAQLRTQNEVDGPAFKMKNDPRVTSIGRFLRASSLDELPQLWNVLVGDMSLVGPRPLPCDEANSCASWQRQRLSVTPGLTCIWQVHGRCRVSFVEWMRMDVRYIRSRSVWQDVKLIVLTVPAVLFRRGAH